MHDFAPVPRQIGCVGCDRTLYPLLDPEPFNVGRGTPSRKPGSVDRLEQAMCYPSPSLLCGDSRDALAEILKMTNDRAHRSDVHMRLADKEGTQGQTGPRDQAQCLPVRLSIADP